MCDMGAALQANVVVHACSCTLSRNFAHPFCQDIAVAGAGLQLGLLRR